VWLALIPFQRKLALVPGLCVPAAMRAMIKTVHLSVRRFIDDGWLPMVLFAAVMLAAFLSADSAHPPLRGV
jgi:hypothetical protein